jgi:hypothetical protein
VEGKNRCTPLGILVAIEVLDEVVAFADVPAQVFVQRAEHEEHCSPLLGPQIESRYLVAAAHQTQHESERRGCRGAAFPVAERQLADGHGRLLERLTAPPLGVAWQQIGWAVAVYVQTLRSRLDGWG